MEVGGSCSLAFLEISVSKRKDISRLASRVCVKFTFLVGKAK